MNYFYSTAFTECIHRHEIQTLTKSKFDKTLIVKVQAPQLRTNQRLALSGSVAELGNWQEREALKCLYTGDNEWTAVIDATNLTGKAIEMKYIVEDDDPSVPVIWEARMNRVLHIPEIKSGKTETISIEMAHFPIPADRIAGTAIPIFSLRSEGSFGVGDFGDLKKMVDWVALTGQRILQVLPINDTTITRTWSDSYPYSSISIFALHPQYADFRQLPPLKDWKKATEFEKLRKELNALPQIDYERVNNAKNEYLHLIFEQEGKKVLASEEYKQWFKEEEQWLVPYAQYSVLRDTYGTANYSEWPDHNVWNEDDRKSLTNPRSKAYKKASYYYYLQTHKVALKGDIPIGVNRYGCDVWMEPRYFNLNGQTGAPPDDFSVNGQNWGFPTYNWDEMLKDDCQWWIRRFQNMAKYFDAYRIDHVLGFFRIWEIPIHSVHGLLGQFQPSLGMTRQEVEQYGLKWQEDFFLNPFITDWVLERLFGDKAEYVKNTFLEPWHDGLYKFREGFKTQREVEKATATASPPALPRREGAANALKEQSQNDSAVTANALKEQSQNDSAVTANALKEQSQNDSAVTANALKEQLQNDSAVTANALKEQSQNDNAVTESAPSLRGRAGGEAASLREGIYSLQSNVLFLVDHKNQELVHPRISAQSDTCYETLWEHDKYNFNRLYNDYFYRRNNQFWYEEAMKKLPRLVEATKMLVCAEDLGMVPDCVPWVINQLEILSLEIQSMPKDPQVAFGVLDRNPFMSVCTISSHDTATLRMWWDEDEERTQNYWNWSLGHEGKAPHPLSPEIATEIVSNHLACPSMLCILTLQDWLATDATLRLADANAERINIPANPRHYWRYRMHLTIEQLMQATEFNEKIKNLVNQTRG